MTTAGKPPRRWAKWQEAADKATLQSLAAGSTPGTLTAKLRLPTGVCELTYALHADGKLQVGMILTCAAKAPELPWVGLQFAIPSAMGNVRWFGRGPHENYWDRKTGAAIGIHQNTVNEWTTRYVRPQENANRCDVR